MNTSKKTHFLRTAFHFGTCALLIFLPWSSFFSVFLGYGIGLPGANFLKEILFFFVFLCGAGIFVQDFLKTKKNPFHFSLIDILILVYFIVMILVTLPTTGIRGLIFGGRYDFFFLGIFLFFYHTYQYLEKSLSYYIKIFLISAGAMLLVSGLLKYPLSEDLLLYFGYSGDISAWRFGFAPPAYHNIPGAQVRRFQGLLDNPNTMGAFLIMFIGFFLYYTRYKKDWYFVLGIVVLALVLMLLYTYSRSAMLGLVVMIGIVCLSFFSILLGKYKKQAMVIGVTVGIIIGVIFFKYAGSSGAILEREGSNKGHFDRMKIGVERVLEKPIGSGLGSSGPAYRHVMNLKGLTRDEIEEKDLYYIPESWYIQQFVEGGILGGVLFVVIMATLFFLLMGVNPLLGGAFAGVNIINLFLHTFESSVFSYVFFLLVGLVLAYQKQKRYEK